MTKLICPSVNNQNHKHICKDVGNVTVTRHFFNFIFILDVTKCCDKWIKTDNISSKRSRTRKNNEDQSIYNPTPFYSG